MTNPAQKVKYLCGHQWLPDAEIFANREELYRAAEAFLCPECCRQAAQELHLDTQIYVNMQSLSAEMSALVLEVTACCRSLEGLLSLIGYARSGPSRDELTPRIESWSERHAVWRKEFWFDATTNPFHVIALIDLVKDEAHWLSAYLPDKGAVRYLDFPGDA